MTNDYDDYYDDREWHVWALGAGALVVSAAILWFGIGAIVGDDDDAARLAATNAASESPVTVAVTDAPSDTVDDDTVDDDVEDGDTGLEDDTVLTSEPENPSTTVASSSDPDPTVPQGPVSYATLPDGNPIPVLVIFDDDLITISGVVPSDAAGERLRILALANSTAREARVASFLTVNPDVPITVGVRMIEANSPQFDLGAPTISLAYIAQLDRIVALMNSLPTVTAEVVGHTDQTGDDASNLELSTERAELVADYMESRGIDPTRLESRGAGATDLLTLNNDAAALALNSRVEFILSGLLVDL